MKNRKHGIIPFITAYEVLSENASASAEALSDMSDNDRKTPDGIALTKMASTMITAVTMVALALEIALKAAQE